MVSAILHVEDDPALTDIVALQIESFGFRGDIVAVDAVAKAETVLDERVRDGGTFDLIISDMNLPDGSGLDVVRYVRASPAWERTPILILSGDLDPKKVGRAYALGANAYVNKTPRGRTLDQVVRTLYDHWARDMALPSEPTPMERTFARASMIRARHASVYQRLAQCFAESRTESAFWLSRAVSESNLTNLLAFLRRNSENREFPAGLHAEMDAMQTATEDQLTLVEKALVEPDLSRPDAYGHILELLGTLDIDALSRAIAHLFPIMPVAMTALRDFLVGTIEDVTAWVDLHTVDPTLRARATMLRVEIESLR